MLDVRSLAAHFRTGDMDIVQFQSISMSIGDSPPPCIDPLWQVDASFQEISRQANTRHATAFRNHKGFLAEFLMPNTSKDV